MAFHEMFVLHSACYWLQKKENKVIFTLLQNSFPVFVLIIANEKYILYKLKMLNANQYCNHKSEDHNCMAIKPPTYCLYYIYIYILPLRYVL